MNGISVFQHSSLSTLKSFIILLRAFAMAPNEFIIRAAKDASGNFTGLMNCNPALIKFGDTKQGKNNMKFTNITYQNKRIAIETPEMDIPAGVVQYPKAEDTVAGQPVSYSLLMSFNDIEERADLKAFKEFMDALQQRVLDMAVSRSEELFQKVKSREVLSDIQSQMVRESDKYAPSFAIGLAFDESTDSTGAEVVKPRFTTYDFNMIMEKGLRADGSPRPECVIDSIHDVNMKRGSVKVIFPFSSVWSQAKSFGVSFKAREVLVIRTGGASNGFDFDVGAKKDGDDALLEPSDGEEEEGDVNKELDNLGLDDE
jgi:hypothetical protein